MCNKVGDTFRGTLDWPLEQFNPLYIIILVYVHFFSSQFRPQVFIGFSYRDRIGYYEILIFCKKLGKGCRIIVVILLKAAYRCVRSLRTQKGFGLKHHWNCDSIKIKLYHFCWGANISRVNDIILCKLQFWWRFLSFMLIRCNKTKWLALGNSYFIINIAHFCRFSSCLCRILFLISTVYK